MNDDASTGPSLYAWRPFTSASRWQLDLVTAAALELEHWIDVPPLGELAPRLLAGMRLVGSCYEAAMPAHTAVGGSEKAERLLQRAEESLLVMRGSALGAHDTCAARGDRWGVAVWAATAAALARLVSELAVSSIEAPAQHTGDADLVAIRESCEVVVEDPASADLQSSSG